MLDEVKKAEYIQYSHPVLPGVPPHHPGGSLSHPASAPAGPRTCSPAPGMRAAHTSMPTPPADAEEKAQKL